MKTATMTNLTIVIGDKTYVMELGMVEETMLGIEDHGIFSSWLHIDFGGTGQGAGGYSLDSPVSDEDGKHIGRFGSAFGAQWIMDTLKVVGVDSWERVKGSKVYVLRKDEWSSIEGLAHWLKPETNYMIFADVKAVVQ